MSLNWVGWNKFLYEAWIEIIFHSIACIVTLVIIGIYIKFSNTNVCRTCKNIKTRMKKGFHGFLVASLILSFVYIYLFYINNVIFIIILGYRWNNGCFISGLYQLIFVFQRIITYSFYILRLNVTFKGSVFEVSKKNIRIMMILLIVVLGSSAFPSIIAGYLINNFKCSGDYYKYYIYGGIWFNFVDISWCIILSIIYIKKLRQLLKNVHAKTDQIRFIVNKLSVLAFVTVLSTLILWCIIFVTLKWTHTLVSIDLIINNICIMLSFKEFDPFYQYLCCCCNDCCDIRRLNPRKSSVHSTRDEIKTDQTIIIPYRCDNKTTGEPTAMTSDTTVNDIITETDNEGRFRILVSNENNDNITPGFDITNNELSSNNISFTSKIRDKNDAIIQRHLAANQIAIIQATKQ